MTDVIGYLKTHGASHSLKLGRTWSTKTNGYGLAVGEFVSHDLCGFGCSGSSKWKYENLGVLDFHIRWDTAFNPVMDPLRAPFVKSEQLGDLGWAAKFGYKFCVSHGAY